ncbi:MAG: GNAT family N-acetyltransferase [Nocardioidaceae bacterium]
MTITVRSPHPCDVDQLARINLAAWRSAYDGIVARDYLDAMEVGTYRKKWADLIRAVPEGTTCLVADLDGVLASYALCGPYRTQQDAPPEEQTDGWGELQAIYTHPDLQGRGAGSAVHELVLDRLRSEGYVEAALWVLHDNQPSIDWYTRRGWRADGSTSHWVREQMSLTEIRLRHQLSS